MFVEGLFFGEITFEFLGSLDGKCNRECLLSCKAKVFILAVLCIGLREDGAGGIFLSSFFFFLLVLLESEMEQLTVSFSFTPTP